MNGDGVIPLSYVDLLIAAGFMLLCGGMSVGLRLGLGKQIGVATARTVLQLVLIGYVLTWVFRVDSPAVLVGLLVVMIGVAAHAAVGRSGRRYPGALGRTFATLVFSGLLTTFLVTDVVIRVEPWYRPQYVIPLLGMILGNGLTGVSLCLDYLLEALHERRAEVEAELALGATRWEAAAGPVRQAVRRGMIPIINSMMVVGIVSLPGMMTGQILSGTDPLVAVRYQIVVMFMIAAATMLSCVGIAMLTCGRLFNARHQLMVPLIRRV